MGKSAGITPCTNTDAASDAARMASEEKRSRSITHIPINSPFTGRTSASCLDTRMLLYVTNASIRLNQSWSFFTNCDKMFGFF